MPKKKLIFFTDSTFQQKKDSVFADSLSQIKEEAFVQVYGGNNKQSFEQGKLNNGIKVGLWKSYVDMLDHTVLQDEKLYSPEGDMTNFKAYDYDTKQVVEDKNYLHDQLTGIQKEFYPTGNLHVSFETDEKGKYINDFIVLSEKGETIFASHLGSQGTGYIKYYDKDNFLIWEGSFKNKKKEGWHHEYMPDAGRKATTKSILYQDDKPVKTK
ncbi:hypothetical protein [Flavobacterium amniphilum]|uniref:hypothetical protein n=1 Tax=Flavobacterium amniphilum TaxID=1834035 RepID=UPI00202A5B30|nr:hypothetical protein [Flavobacterium amniphilum]